MAGSRPGIRRMMVPSSARTKDLLADQIESLARGALHGACSGARDLNRELPVVAPPASPISSLGKNCWLLSADKEEQDKQEDGCPAERAPTRLTKHPWFTKPLSI
ncbi:unnamed protein product [Urochloa humidicola]